MQRYDGKMDAESSTTDSSGYCSNSSIFTDKNENMTKNCSVEICESTELTAAEFNDCANCERQYSVDTNHRCPCTESKNKPHHSGNDNSVFVKNVKLRTSSILKITVLANLILIIINSAIFWSLNKWTIKNKSQFQPSVCVLDNHQAPLCSNHAKHIHYLLYVIQSRANINHTADAVQSNLSFSKNKGTKNSDSSQKALMKSKRSAHSPVVNTSTLLFKDNQIIIGETKSYLISLQLLFKRELRLKHTTNSSIVVNLVKEHGQDNRKAKMLSKIFPVMKGSQAMQSFQLLETFRFDRGDKIAVYVSEPSLVYKCKGCNKVTVMAS